MGYQQIRPSDNRSFDCFMGVINVPRKRRKCHVEFLPPATYYKPAGVPLRELEEVALSVEEFEALRLKDMEGLEQIQCAERMGVARTTYQRILYAAREKIAEALVEGKAIRIEGGRYVLLSDCGYRCTECGHEFEKARGTGQGMICCPGCGKGTDHLERALKGHGQRRRHGFGGGYRSKDGGTAQNDGSESDQTSESSETSKMPEKSTE